MLNLPKSSNDPLVRIDYPLIPPDRFFILTRDIYLQMLGDNYWRSVDNFDQIAAEAVLRAEALFKRLYPALTIKPKDEHQSQPAQG